MGLQSVWAPPAGRRWRLSTRRTREPSPASAAFSARIAAIAAASIDGSDVPSDQGSLPPSPLIRADEFHVGPEAERAGDVGAVSDKLGSMRGRILGVALALVASIGACELVAGLGDPVLRQPDAGAGAGGSGGGA